MRAFAAAAEAGSLTAAARKLGWPLATLSRKVSELEAHLGARLFVRTTRKLEFTDAGRAYWERCAAILDDITEAERAAAGEYAEPRGALHITAPIVLGRLHVAPVVTEFLAAYPQIDVRLSLTDGVANLSEEHIDAAIRVGALPDSSMIATKIGDVRLITCASPDYLAACGAPAMPADLAAHSCVNFEGVSAADTWVFRLGKKALSIGVRARLSVNNAEAAIDAAVAGAGIVRVFSYQAAEHLRSGALRAVLDAYAGPPAPAHIVHLGGTLPRKTRAFLDFAAPLLRTRLGR